MKHRELTIGEILEDAMMYLDFGPEVMTLAEPDGYYCDMEPSAFELARASIAYLSYRLLLPYRMKQANQANPGSWVAMRRYQDEVYEEIASVLSVSGTRASCIDEVRRLYKVASKTRDEDEAYRNKIDGIVQDFEENYELDPKNLGITFI